MKRFDTVAIVGVGLIGGSLGMALRQRRLANRVVGIGRRQSSLRIARRIGAVDTATVNLAKGVAEAELVVVCSPVERIVDHVRQAAEHCPEEALITDAGSTKQAIVSALDGKLPRGCRFLGGHPLAGSEKSGPLHARADLFEGRVALLTPTKNTRAEDFDLLECFWSEVGSVVVQMSPEEHDWAVALSSHLPHAVAVALAAMLPEQYFRITGTGFLDTTRIAAASPELWRQIFLTNRENLLRGLDQLEQQLGQFREALRQHDTAALENWLAKGKKNRDALGS